LGYGVRAYVLRGTVATDQPVEISVRMTPHPELAELETLEIPRTGRPGRKNLVQNRKALRFRQDFAWRKGRLRRSACRSLARS